MSVIHLKTPHSNIFQFDWHINYASSAGIVITTPARPKRELSPISKNPKPCLTCHQSIVSIASDTCAAWTHNFTAVLSSLDATELLESLRIGPRVQIVVAQIETLHMSPITCTYRLWYMSCMKPIPRNRLLLCWMRNYTLKGCMTQLKTQFLKSRHMSPTTCVYRFW